MKTITTDRGETAIAIGAPCSLERVKVQYPALIERLNALYNGEAKIDEAVNAIRQAGVRSELETNSLLAASHYGDGPNIVRDMVYSVARTNLRLFCDTYATCLAYAHREFPLDYAWPESELPAVTAKMLKAIERGSYNKDSRAFKATCKQLGIAHTYKAINAFIA